jgi:sec-independent protein translocase protein TatA
VPFGIGIWEILILLLVVLLVFGPKRLPEMGRSLGRGMREFKDSVSGKDFEDDEPASRPAAPELSAGQPVVPAHELREPVHESQKRDTVS